MRGDVFGIEEVASKVLGLPTRKASFTPGSIAPELARHENATVLGLLHYGLEDHGLPGRKRKDNEEGIFTKLKDLIGIGRPSSLFITQTRNYNEPRKFSRTGYFIFPQTPNCLLYP